MAIYIQGQDDKVQELHFLMKDLGISKIFPGPSDFEPRSAFVFEGKEIICTSEELLPKMRELMQIRILEDKAKATKGNDFGWAIIQLKDGHKVARMGWNGKGMWLELQVPDSGSKMSLPYIYMKTADEQLVPWLASQTDMLSEDWEINND